MGKFAFLLNPILQQCPATRAMKFLTVIQFPINHLLSLYFTLKLVRILRILYPTRCYNSNLIRIFIQYSNRAKIKKVTSSNSHANCCTEYMLFRLVLSTITTVRNRTYSVIQHCMQCGAQNDDEDARSKMYASIPTYLDVLFFNNCPIIYPWMITKM